MLHILIYYIWGKNLLESKRDGGGKWKTGEISERMGEMKV